jgi:hypothetical protein
MRSKYDKADHSPFYRWFVDVGEEAQERLGRAWFVIELKRIQDAEGAYFDRSQPTYPTLTNHC